MFDGYWFLTIIVSDSSCGKRLMIVECFILIGDV